MEAKHLQNFLNNPRMFINEKFKSYPVYLKRFYVYNVLSKCRSLSLEDIFVETDISGRYHTYTIMPAGIQWSMYQMPPHKLLLTVYNNVNHGKHLQKFLNDILKINLPQTLFHLGRIYQYNIYID